jgi:drug/metabolite transporter (DMT)-like permease
MTSTTHAIERPAPRVGVLPALRRWSPTPRVATLVIVATSVAYAFTAFFARRLTDAGLAPATVAFARFALMAVVLAPFVRVDPARRRATLWGFVGGAVMAVGWVAYVHAVETGAVAVAGVVYLTYPLFTAVSLAVVFRVRVGARQVVGGALVVVAGVVALGVGDGGGVPLVAVVAPATFGFSIAVLTERLGVLDPFERLASTALGAVAGLVPVVGDLPVAEIVPSSADVWLGVAVFGVVCALVPMLLYAACAPVVGASRSAVAGSAELPTVFVIGAVFFGEAVRPQHLAAAVVVVAAIAVTPATRAPHVRPDDATGAQRRPRT